MKLSLRSLSLSLYLPPSRSESLSPFLSFSLVLNPELTARKKRRDAEYKAKVRNEWRDINLRRLALRSPRTWYGTIVPRVSSRVCAVRFDLSISPFLSRSLMCAPLFFSHACNYYKSALLERRETVYKSRNGIKRGNERRFRKDRPQNCFLPRP